MVRTINLFGLLFGVWLLLSGFYSPFFLTVGVICCGLVLVIVARMDAVDGDPPSYRFKWKLFTYLPWLGWQIILANFDVLRLVQRGPGAIDPRIEWVPAGQKSDLGLAIYANSITLTPGTISTSVEPGRILVHALKPDGIAALRAGDMDAAVRDVET